MTSKNTVFLRFLFKYKSTLHALLPPSPTVWAGGDQRPGPSARLFIRSHPQRSLRSLLIALGGAHHRHCGHPLAEPGQFTVSEQRSIHGEFHRVRRTCSSGPKLISPRPKRSQLERSQNTEHIEHTDFSRLQGYGNFDQIRALGEF